MLIVFSFYFAKFHNGFSDTKGDWGTFGDYVGGILNPVIAAFAFYLIAETYKLQIKAYDLQKTELEETRKLLKVSTDAQNDQVKLAALTALFNSNLTRIGLLKSERIELLNGIPAYLRPQATDTRSNEDLTDFDAGGEQVFLKESIHIIKKVREINGEIQSLTNKNNELEQQIVDFLKEK
ncbi:MAG: hypothetical protein Q8L79_08605 [Methylobacter sp.]|uniref:hypothetical protein n=1 Tax=Methylobacter sp. TaxID=2051955 RepID=UPI002730798A|nr:hypothetical protein [Methylobacter sp.]MDP1665176.1 hypothetical protein [Methylobacter sp.]